MVTYTHKNLACSLPTKNNINKIIKCRTRLLKLGCCAVALGLFVAESAVAVKTPLESLIEKTFTTTIPPRPSPAGPSSPREESAALLQPAMAAPAPESSVVPPKPREMPALPGDKLRVTLDETDAFRAVNIRSKETGKNKGEKFFAVITPQVQYAAFSAHDEEGVVFDYYHFVITGDITPDFGGGKEHYLPKEYKLRWNIKGVKDDRNVSVPQTLPKTTLGEQTRTSTIGVKLSAELSPSAAASTGKVGGEFSWQRTKTTIVKDVDVGNIIEGQIPGWRYRLNNKDSEVKKAGMDFDQEWIWRVNREEAKTAQIYQSKAEGTCSFVVEGTLESKWQYMLSKSKQSCTLPALEVHVPTSSVQNGTVLVSLRPVAPPEAPAKPAPSSSSSND